MKKCIDLFLLSAMLYALTACGTANMDSGSKFGSDLPLPPAEVEVKDGDFVYRLYTEKDVYEEYSDLAIFAELTYIGEEESIVIYHADSPFYFPLEEMTREIKVDYPMNEILKWTTLKQGEPFRQKYSFAGGYSDEDDKAYADFVKTIIKKGFPEGKYIIHGSAEFYTEDGKNKENKLDYKISGDIGFSVVRKVQ